MSRWLTPVAFHIPKCDHTTHSHTPSSHKHIHTHTHTHTAMSAYAPSEVALSNIVKAQLSLTRSLISSSRQMAESSMRSLNTDYHYTTLKETKEVIYTRGVLKGNTGAGCWGIMGTTAQHFQGTLVHAMGNQETRVQGIKVIREQQQCSARC